MRLASPLCALAAGADRSVLVTAVTVLSAFVKNIGALAMMIPVAFQLARRTGRLACRAS